jgi:hypothetical protein
MALWDPASAKKYADQQTAKGKRPVTAAEAYARGLTLLEAEQGTELMVSRKAANWGPEYAAAQVGLARAAKLMGNSARAKKLTKIPSRSGRTRTGYSAAGGSKKRIRGIEVRRAAGPKPGHRLKIAAGQIGCWKFGRHPVTACHVYLLGKRSGSGTGARARSHNVEGFCTSA